MDGTPRHHLKRICFLGFLLASFALIVLIWTEHLSADQAGSPQYYRATQPVDAALYATRTAGGQNFGLETSGSTRQPEDQKGTPPGESVPLTPVPTIDWDAVEEDQ